MTAFVPQESTDVDMGSLGTGPFQPIGRRVPGPSPHRAYRAMPLRSRYALDA